MKYTKAQAEEVEAKQDSLVVRLKALQREPGWKDIVKAFNEATDNLKDIENVGGSNFNDIAVLTLSRQIALREIRRLRDKLIIK